jgi:hypothetical protein
MTLATGAFVIKLFTIVINSIATRVFVISSHFYPALIFVIKTRRIGGGRESRKGLHSTRLLPFQID